MKIYFERATAEAATLSDGEALCIGITFKVLLSFLILLSILIFLAEIQFWFTYLR